MVVVVAVGGGLFALTRESAPPDVLWMRSPRHQFRLGVEDGFTLAPRGERLSAEYFVVTIRTPPGYLVLGKQEPAWRRLLARIGFPSSASTERWFYDCDLDTTVQLDTESWYQFVRRSASSPGS
jgi:hypothetical protein